MNTVLWIILVFVALLGGFYGGAYFARKQMEKELAENPRLNVDAVRTKMSAAGQKPNEAKVRQTYNQIIKQQNFNIKVYFCVFDSENKAIYNKLTS